MRWRVPIVVVWVAAATFALVAAISASPDVSVEYPAYQSFDRPLVILHAPFYRGDKQFPYQCGPFPENLSYGPGYDERCVYPYYKSRDSLLPQQRMPAPASAIADDIAARWITYDLLEAAWHGDPNGVTGVEFALLDDGGVVMQRLRADYPPYIRSIYIPYGAVSIRVRTFGLLQSPLKETIVQLPVR